jgi:hypothetical protein
VNKPVTRHPAVRPHEIYVIAVLHGARNAAKILRARVK